jgi:hypothetical protein
MNYLPLVRGKFIFLCFAGARRAVPLRLRTISYKIRLSALKVLLTMRCAIVRRFPWDRQGQGCIDKEAVRSCRWAPYHYGAHRLILSTPSFV